MPGQVQKARPRVRRDPASTESAGAADGTGVRAAVSVLKDDLDDILDEIDAVLAENVLSAEEFVASYVQKGGE